MYTLSILNDLPDIAARLQTAFQTTRLYDGSLAG